MSESSSQSFRGMLALAVGLVASAFIVAAAVRSVKRANDTITVTGSAKQPIRSDFVTWRGRVSSRQPTMQAAYRDVKRYSERLRLYFREEGVPESLVTFHPIQTHTIQETLPGGRTSGRAAAYNLSQSFEISSDRVDGVTALSRRATDLINEGVELESHPPQYVYTGLSERRIEMLEAAARDARERAEAIATSVGCTIGVVRNVRMGSSRSLRDTRLP